MADRKKRGGKTPSMMWQFFEKRENGFAQCVVCSQLCSYKSTTSNLKRHIERLHPNICTTSLSLDMLNSDEDPRESLKEFISLEAADGTILEGEEGEEEPSANDPEWTPPAKKMRKHLTMSSSTTTLHKKIKPELISSNGVDYLIYTQDQPQQRASPAQPVLTKVSAVPQRPPTITLPREIARIAPTSEEDEFACFARFLSKRIRALKDPYWQSCAINEINSALHKVEMRRYEPPRVITVGSDFSVQTDTVAAPRDPLSPTPEPVLHRSLPHHEAQQVVEEIITHDDDNL